MLKHLKFKTYVGTYELFKTCEYVISAKSLQCKYKTYKDTFAFTLLQTGWNNKIIKSR